MTPSDEWRTVERSLERSCAGGLPLKTMFEHTTKEERSSRLIDARRSPAGRKRARGSSNTRKEKCSLVPAYAPRTPVTRLRRSA